LTIELYQNRTARIPIRQNNIQTSLKFHEYAWDTRWCGLVVTLDQQQRILSKSDKQSAKNKKNNCEHEELE
jgi:hypothetical protein